MKKLFALLLALAMVATFCACSPEDVEVFVEETAEAIEEITEETPVEEIPAEEAPVESGIRPEFKEAMDAYEAFYDEYCDVMKKYMANPTDLSLLGKYSDVMQKSIEVDEAFEKWDSENMSNEELSYYLEVTTRVSQKLLEVAS